MTDKIGIIIAYPPNVISESHGLIRLLSFLIEGFIDNEYNVEIICPEWSREEVTQLLKFTHKPKSVGKITILSTKKIPPILFIHSWISKRFQSTKRPVNIAKWIEYLKRTILKGISKLLGTHSWSKFSITLIILLFLIPIIILCIFLSWVISKLASCLSYLLYPKVGRISNLMKSSLIDIKDDLFARDIFNEIYQKEMLSLVKIANNHKKIQTWLIPTVFWPEIVKKIHRSVVICPDIIIHEFPVRFEFESIDNNLLVLSKRIEDSVRAAYHIITFSEHVKRKHLSSRFAINPDSISIIPHGFVSLSSSLHALKPFEELKDVEKKDYCLYVIKEYLRDNIDFEYIRNFDLSGVKFLFYSSHIRPHKNIPQLIKAFNYLLHKSHEPIKLVLTGDAKKNKYTASLINQLGISRDIIILHNIPTKVLAALCHLSYLAINPTFFEGGFPFTFSEAYSVGTPSIMSKIPAVTEVITDNNIQEIMLFDPYNLNEMIERMEWGLHNREYLIDIQKPIYETLKKRTWVEVSREYANILRMVGPHDMHFQK